MKLKNLLFAALSIFAFVIAGCGGGGGGGGAPASTTFSGVVSKGPVQNATVKIYQINQSGAKVTPAIGQGPTDTNGNYSITVGGTVTGPVLVEVTHGKYKDDATPTVFKNISTEFPATGSAPGGLRAFLAEASGATGSVNVTPLTEMAVQKNGTNPMTPANINTANDTIATAFFGAGTTVDIVKTKPLDPTASFPVGATDDQKAYAVRLAGLAQFQATAANNAPLQADVLNKFLSSINAATDHSLGAVTAAYVTATGAFLANASANPNGTTIGNIVTGLSFTASATTSFAGNPLTLTATVVSVASAAPTGATVTFTVSPATSATLTPASQTTTNGVATVTLTGSALGQTTVTATAGSMSKTLAFNFVDPNAPAAMDLGASAAASFLSTDTGTNNVTINATSILRAAGGNVSDGTPVTFAVSGVGTLDKTSVLTSGGAASAVISSATAGTATVTATIGTVSKIVTVNFVKKPTTATVVLATSGSLDTGKLIAGITASLSYDSSKGLSLLNVVPSGNGKISFTYPSPLIVNDTTVTPPKVTLAILTALLGGALPAPVGEFATLTFTVSPSITVNNIPTASNFGVVAADTIILDNTVNPITGQPASIQLTNIAVIIQSVNIQ